MAKTKFYNLITILALAMAVIQAPLFYYYTSGLLTFFIVTPYMIIGFGLSLWLLIRVLKNKNSVKPRFQKAGVILTILIGSFTLFLVKP